MLGRLRTRLVVVFIRHGHAESNVEGRVGQIPSTPLTTMGVKQAELLGEYFKTHNEEFDVVYSSPAKRAMQTATTSLGYCNKKYTIIEDRRLMEIHRGEWEGQKSSDVFRGQYLIDNLTNPFEFKAPGGESEKEVEERMTSFFDEIQNTYYPKRLQEIHENRALQNKKEATQTKEVDEKNDTNILATAATVVDGENAARLIPDITVRVAVYSHGVAIRTLVRRILQANSLNFRAEYANTSRTEFCLDQDQVWRIQAINRTTHLYNL
eukprot:TRINITY_DN2421_c0_g1_i1.p1 TRINITY_DN2421_c0_g1~~TRINITY_DN2421_c0_g1_i1.p1  ORF type:complete len:266 (-),score=63.07 TRINITY_DN2421_c0_g1_i1:170-967(-)